MTRGQTNQDSAQFKTIVHDIHDWKLRARLLERNHVSQMTQIKLARDSFKFSVCVFFVCFCLFSMGLICIFIYLSIYSFH